MRACRRNKILDVCFKNKENQYGSVRESKMASEIIEAVGGKGNVAAVTHCMTRLRFNLKDEAKSSDDAINKVAGVIKVIHAGN